ncbi:hypothetical protein J7400_20865 [Shimia sp. R9_2]|uniref:hypothetical protein n=1 Tax=Shimia sp. R9_2 TaxID=2821112 RepID=UPI001ADC41F9|nr:hypothetical protein [Shimia sp. R9_2]MBO9399135.1 hypothetical protein [Shimia sp. R9_2]
MARETDKDIWDKLEIAGKVTGAVLVPVTIAYSVYLWNAERSALQTSATMTGIAVSVLTAENIDGVRNSSALKDWAIAVLEAPEDPPRLNDEAAQQLQGLAASEAFDLGIASSFMLGL